LAQETYDFTDEEYENDGINDDQVNYEQEYSFDLPIIPFISHAEKRHKALSKLLKINKLHDGDQKSTMFITIAALVDPMTQPMESDHHVISLETISDLIISFFYRRNSIIPVFELSSALFQIIEQTLEILNCKDELKLRSLNNSDLKVDWRIRLGEWTPHGINDGDLRLIYMIDCACIYSIYKLYLKENNDLCLNPFLGAFLKLWKIFTNLVLLGLEIDRRIESDPDIVTPAVVKQVIRGSSSIRYILASILNDDVQNRLHDFHHVNILDFQSPFGRRTGSGALKADVRWYVGAMLALGSDLNEVVETLIDLEPNDRYDEDIRYMFDYEYEDFHYDELVQDDEENAGTNAEDDEDDDGRGAIVYEDEEGHLHKIVRKRCTCEFPSEGDEDQDNHKIAEMQSYKTDTLQSFAENKESVPTAVRSDETIEFDELGRDWRDIPRGGNIFFNTSIRLDDSTCLNWAQTCAAFQRMTQGPISHEEAQKVVFTIARSVKMEFENEINRSVGDKKQPVDENSITPDKIYEKWSVDWVFEPMLTYNPTACYAMLDEMLMAHGYRRVIIWFITHLSLSFQLFNYVFELLDGIRGEKSHSNDSNEGNDTDGFVFSRQGPLELSEIEKSMLLHEFLNNCLIYLSKNSGPNGESVNNSDTMSSEGYGNLSDFEKNVKIVKLVCMLIAKLTLEGKIELEEYKIELTTLLINWIGVVPEARAIFFKLNNNDEIKAGGLDSPSTLEDPQEHGIGMGNSEDDDELILKPAMKRNRKFNPQLKTLLGNVLKKLADNNKTGNLLFQPFFELINHDSEIESPNADESAETQLAKDEYVNNSYVPGVLKPLKKNEILEHEKIEDAISQ